MLSSTWQARLVWSLCAGAGLLGAGAEIGHAQLFQRQGTYVCPPTPYGATPQAVPVPAASAPGQEPKKADDPATPAPTTAPTTPGLDTSSPYDNTDLGATALSTIDSAVGYIDNAIPSNQLRLRFDAAWGNNRPTRAEFFYPQYAPGGPGLPFVDVNTDYQEAIATLEATLRPDFSFFVETPVRFLNPTINANTAGFSDLNAGCKWAFLSDEDQVATFQLRVFAPTGDGSKGLGTEHVSLEPALLWFGRMTERLHVESELRLWVPIDGTSFAGEVLRYGVGFSYGERSRDCWWLTPVVEVVGWTVLRGQDAVTVVPPIVIADAAGDTIVNAKVGVRLGMGDRFDVYSGYGRALTGEVWYKDIWRTELRIGF